MFSTKKRFNSAARIFKHRNARSCLTSLHNDIRRARIISSYVEAGDLDATRIICGNFPRRHTTPFSSVIMQLQHYASMQWE